MIHFLLTFVLVCTAAWMAFILLGVLWLALIGLAVSTAPKDGGK